MADDIAGELIERPNELKDKAGRPPTAEELRVLEKAEQAMEKLGDKYVEAAGHDAANLLKALEKLKGDPGNPQLLDEIFQIAHDMKGQGGSFGYPLVSTIGYRLCRFIERVQNPGQLELAAITLHVEAMNLVVRSHIKGDGGEQGAALIKGLDMMLAKFSH